MRNRNDPYGPYHRYVVENGSQQDHNVLGWVIFFLVLALVIALVAWILLRVFAPRTGEVVQAVDAPPDSALDVVRMRYARGEIDRREFLRVTADLGVVPEPPLAPST